MGPPEGPFVAAASANYGEMYRGVDRDEQQFPPPYLDRSFYGLLSDEELLLVSDVVEDRT